MDRKDIHPSIADGTIHMGEKKNIALIAHDHRKLDLIDWAKYNKSRLDKHNLYGTGTTGKMISDEVGLNVHRFESGPLGGDLQIGSAIVDREIDLMIFFWDPLQAQPHDVDVKALLRITVVYNVPIACNRSTADFLISSPIMNDTYDRYVVDYSKRMKTDIT